MTAEQLKSLPVKLTPAERRYCVLLAMGFDTRQIAERAGVTPQVVKNYLHIVMRKTQCRHRVELVAKLFRYKYEGVWA